MEPIQLQLMPGAGVKTTRWFSTLDTVQRDRTTHCLLLVTVVTAVTAVTVVMAHVILSTHVEHPTADVVMRNTSQPKRPSMSSRLIKSTNSSYPG